MSVWFCFFFFFCFFFALSCLGLLNFVCCLFLYICRCCFLFVCLFVCLFVVVVCLLLFFGFVFFLGGGGVVWFTLVSGGRGRGVCFYEGVWIGFEVERISGESVMQI